MNTSALVDAVASETGLSKADSKRAVDAVFGRIAGELATGSEVSINGFGKFRVKTSAARVGRNPKTGEPVNIPTGKSIGFKNSTTLKAAL